MSAVDVKYGRALKNPATGAVNFEVFNDVAAIVRLDDLTVVVRMSRTNAPFP